MKKQWKGEMGWGEKKREGKASVYRCKRSAQNLCIISAGRGEFNTGQTKLATVLLPGIHESSISDFS